MEEQINPYENSLYVNNVLYIENNNKTESEKVISKKNRKKLKKRNFKLNSIKVLDSENLREQLLRMIKMKKETNLIVLSDTNELIHTTHLPLVPKEWDILYLECNPTKIDYTYEYNNVYWCKADIYSSGHFVINKNSLSKIIKCLKEKDDSKEKNNSKEKMDLFTLFNKKMICYSMTQYFYSKKKAQETVNYTQINFNKSVEIFDNKIKNEYMYLPNISLICIPSDTNKFYNSLYTFYKLDYPRDKIEMIVIDTIDLAIKLKNVLPDDARIKIINISKKNKDSFIEFPLGYKLNTGVKYAKYDILFNIFDNNVYIAQNFRKLVKTFLVSQKDILISDEYNISNMMYLRNAWNYHTFNEKETEIFDNFINFRKGVVCTVPYNNFGFNENKLPINIELLSDDMKKCYLNDEKMLS